MCRCSTKFTNCVRCCVYDYILCVDVELLFGICHKILYLTPCSECNIYTHLRLCSVATIVTRRREDYVQSNFVITINCTTKETLIIQKVNHCYCIIKLLRHEKSIALLLFSETICKTLHFFFASVLNVQW